MKTTTEQPLKGIELKNLKKKEFIYSKDVYTLYVGRSKSTNILHYVCKVNGKIESVLNRMDEDTKNFFGIIT